MLGVQHGLAGVPSKAKASGLQSSRDVIQRRRKAVHKELLDFLVRPGVVAELSQGTDAQLKDLVFDAVVEVELCSQGREGIFRRSQLLGRCGRHVSQSRDRRNRIEHLKLEDSCNTIIDWKENVRPPHEKNTSKVSNLLSTNHQRYVTLTAVPTH